MSCDAYMIVYDCCMLIICAICSHYCCCMIVMGVVVIMFGIITAQNIYIFLRSDLFICCTQNNYKIFFPFLAFEQVALVLVDLSLELYACGFLIGKCSRLGGFDPFDFVFFINIPIFGESVSLSIVTAQSCFLPPGINRKKLSVIYMASKISFKLNKFDKIITI